MFITAEELKSKIEDKDVFRILTNLNAKPTWGKNKSGDIIVSRTICHCGNKHKLEYYCESKVFHCYTDCGDSFDIIELICRVKKLEFMEAFNFLALQLNINLLQTGFNTLPNCKISDWDFISDLDEDTAGVSNNELSLQKYSEEILNCFQDLFFEDWIKESITVDTMRKYGIKYCTLYQQIVIPHRDKDGQLIGIRCRAMLEEDIAKGKYRPFYYGNIQYAHPLGRNLYGLDINRDAITKSKSIILFEGEKSVMQCDSYYGDSSIATALCGSNLTDYQADMILNMGIENVYIALDKQFSEIGDDECLRWENHIRKRIINKLAQYCNVYIIWDTNNLLPYKSSPTDCGKEIFEELFKNKIYASSASMV